MSYDKVDYTDGETPISEGNLDHMEDGIQDNSQDIEDFKDGTQSVAEADNSQTLQNNSPSDIAEVITGEVSLSGNSNTDITHNFGTQNLIVTLDLAAFSDGSFLFWATQGSGELIGYEFLDENTVRIHNESDTDSDIRYTIAKIRQ